MIFFVVEIHIPASRVFLRVNLSSWVRDIGVMSLAEGEVLCSVEGRLSMISH